MSVFIARSLHVKLHHMVLIRGALLHDYFLYDWHEKDRRHCLHGLRHPRLAMRNACEDYELTKREKNIILRHMFPLTVVPPTCREAWIVCLADKICAVLETLHLSKRRYREYFPMALRESYMTLSTPLENILCTFVLTSAVFPIQHRSYLPDIQSMPPCM